jgi:CheY-like chemotaxis protein
VNILVLEDRGRVSYYMEEALRSRGHTVLSAGNIWEAQYHWDQRSETVVNCIIADLNMSSDGLTPDETERTQEGILTGWVWLTERVYRDDPEMMPRTVIYSEYLDYLKDRLSNDERRLVRQVSKRGSRSTTTEVLTCVQEIQNLPARGVR